MGMAVSKLGHVSKTILINLSLLPKEAPHKNTLALICLALSEKKKFESNGHIHSSRAVNLLRSFISPKTKSLSIWSFAESVSV